MADKKTKKVIIKKAKVVAKEVKTPSKVKSLNIYSAKGNVSTMALPKEFSEKENSMLLAQAVRVYTNRQHPGNSKVKTRAEVDFSKIKLYKQKHTGRARHGARSAPIFVGGGVAHGPHGIRRELTLPKKMKNKALLVALSMKAARGKVILADAVGKISKTKEANQLITKILDKEFSTKKPSNVLIALSSKNGKVNIFFRNIKNVWVTLYDSLNAYEVFSANLIILDKEVFDKTSEDKKKVVKKGKES